MALAELAYWQQTIVRTVLVLAVVLLPAGLFVNLFLFKMVSFMPSRLAPMEAGPYGQLQLVAEVGKFVQKEDIVPAKADRQLFILTQFVGFFVFLVATQAELTQTPFDMPIAESELVAGYMTEYSGLRFLLFFIAEFASAGAFAALAATLFLGGWYLPGLSLDAD